MTTLTQPLTLDDYRAQVVMQLKACAEAAELLSDVRNDARRHTDEPLAAEGLLEGQDLDLLAQHATLLDTGAAATLRAVITTARAVATRALRRLPDPAPAAD